MKPTILSFSQLLLFAGMLFLSACTRERIKGSGPVTTETRNASQFDKVTISGLDKVYITKGNTFSVVVKGYSNLLPYFETEQKGNTLELHYRDGVSVSNSNLEVYITMPAIALLRSSGSSLAELKGPFDCDALETSLSGSGTVLIEGAVVNQFRLTISGSGSLKAFGMVAIRADVGISGSGKAEVTVTEHLKAAISGSGVVAYKGTPTTVESEITGSGKLVRL